VDSLITELPCPPCVEVDPPPLPGISDGVYQDLFRVVLLRSLGPCFFTPSTFDLFFADLAVYSMLPPPSVSDFSSPSTSSSWFASPTPPQWADALPVKPSTRDQWALLIVLLYLMRVFHPTPLLGTGLHRHPGACK